VIATAGHVDHGKSTLVRALTGMEPDRWAEERRRGMTIDLGFAWTTLPSGETVAFVDVPGHERFVPNMLAGAGPVRAALFVVAADEGWMTQSAEHLAALHALDVRHGLLVITRTDLADPRPATEQALCELAMTSLGRPDVVAVSAVNGTGLEALRGSLDRLIARLPAADRSSPVRLWVDRSFSIRGSGTVVTGTLTAGELRTGEELQLARTGEHVHVRALQSLGRATQSVMAVARVAVNLRGVERDHVRRGDALLSPGQFRLTDTVDIRLHGDAMASLPPSLTLHVGAAAVVACLRPLGADTARLSLALPLPLRIGDRALLRDPGRRRVVGGAVMLDVSPPPLRRRGAAAGRALILAEMDGSADERGELARRSLVRRGELERMGVKTSTTPVAGDWLADADHWNGLRGRLAEEVARYVRERPLEAGPPIEAMRRALSLPARELVEALVLPPLVVRGGRVAHGGRDRALPPQVAQAVDELRKELAMRPFHAPSSVRLAELGLGSKELAAAARMGALQRLTGNVVLLPGAVDDAIRLLAALPQPFTPSQAREELGTTRRVVCPLLELLDRQGATRRLPDDGRVVIRERP
jgi:selenocysteine-specific elongation factor